MQVIRYDTAAEFLARAKPWLEKAEAENDLILGISAAMEAHPERQKTEFSCARLKKVRRLSAPR